MSRTSSLSPRYKLAATHAAPINQESATGHTHLQVAALAVGCIQQLTHFELLESQTQHKVAGRSLQRPEAVPAGQRTTHVLVADLRRADVLEDVHRLVAVISRYVRRAATATASTAASSAAASTSAATAT